MIRSSAQLRSFLLLTFLALGAGCASSGSEGGVVGSGISSVVQGNVIEVRPADTDFTETAAAGSANGTTGLPTLIVSVDEAPGIEATTDDSGNFLLVGEFAGALTLRFREISTQETLGTVALEVPLGSTLVLRDVEIRGDLEVPVQLPPPLQLNLEGPVISIDCGTGELRIVDQAPARNLFTLRVDSGTEIVGPEQAPGTCGDIQVGELIRVEEGVVDLRQAVIGAVKLRIAPAEPTPATIRVRRRGTVLRVTCGNAPSVTFQDTDRTDLVRAVLTAETNLLCGVDQEQACECSDIRFGDLVEVAGLRRLDGPDAIEATRVQVRRNLEEFFLVTAVGDVEEIDCAAGSLRTLVRELSGDPIRLMPLELRLDGATVFVCNGRPTCSCADVAVGDRVEMDARIFIDETVLPEAIEVRVLASRRIDRLSAEIIEVDCATGDLRLGTRTGGRIRARLTRETDISYDDQESATCEDLLRRPRRLILSGFIRNFGGESVIIATAVVIERTTVSLPSPSPTFTSAPTPSSTPISERSPTRVRPTVPTAIQTRIRSQTPTPARSRTARPSSTSTPARTGSPLDRFTATPSRSTPTARPEPVTPLRSPTRTRETPTPSPVQTRFRTPFSNPSSSPRRG